MMCGSAVHPGGRRVAPGERGLWKTYESGLARRSLALPKARGSVAARAGRDPATDGGDAALSLAIGLTGRLELSFPGFLAYALGDPEVGTEVALGGGVTELGWSDSGSHVTVGLGATLEARRRFAADAAVIGRVLVQGVRPADDLRRLEAVAGGGVVWDVHPYLSLGLGASYQTTLHERGARSEALYLGGAGVPLASVHLGTVDLDLKPAAVLYEHGIGAALQIGLGAVF